MLAKTEGCCQLAKRVLAGGVFLLVPALTFLFLGNGVLGALRGDSAAGAPLLDSRSFAPRLGQTGPRFRATLSR